MLRFLEIINQQTERLNAIIDDLLTLSRLEQRKGKILKKSCLLVTVISDAVNLCQLQAEKKTAALCMYCADDLVAEINAPLLEQALVNLIINAIKYSEPNKTVWIRAQKEENSVVISVKDEGFGIETRHLDRLFERFYRVDTARSRKLGGTGLGLSIVKHIVQVHEGTIEVESKVGTGTTFIIIFPVS
jgi:two-component system phosphate regulon sensor histidine kinase PhoR